MTRATIVLVIAATICAPVGASGDTPLLLARAGEALVPIVVPDAANPSAAVKDLALYLGKMTGGEFALVSEADHQGGAAIHWGPAHFRPNEADADRERWVLSQVVQLYTDDEGLYITGGGADGCEFAVYAFLEDVCGARFFHPGALGLHMPDLPDLSVEDPNIHQVPSFLYRRMWPSSQMPDRRMYNEWRRWFARSRQGGPGVAMGHNLFRIVPPELYDEHPEYFPMIAGVRVDPRSGMGWQPELANPGVVQLAVDKARARFDARENTYSFSLSMNDSTGWSESPEALAQDPPEFRHTQTDGKARRMIGFANEVAEETSKTNPDRYLVFYAYKSTLVPPAAPACHPNVIASICHWGVGGDAFHPITSSAEISPNNVLYREALEGWDALTDKLIAREYWCSPYADPLLKSGVTPILFEDIPYYRDHGFIACSSEAEADWGNLALNHYIAARLMWNADLDPEELLNDYFAKYYGDAAEPMRDYFTRIWEVAYRHYLPEDSRVELNDEDLDYLAEKLAEATDAVAADELRAARVGMAGEFFVTYRQWRTLMQGDPSTEQIAAYVERLNALAVERTDAVVVGKWTGKFVCAPPKPAPYDGPALTRVMPGAEIPGEALPLAGRRGGRWLALVGEDRLLTARASGVRVAQRYTQRPSWQVVSAAGKAIAAGNTPIDGPSDVEVQVPEPGLYQVQMNAGRNGCAFVGLNCPVVMVGPGYALCEIPGRMYFYVPADCEGFTVTLFAGKGESALMRIFNPDGEQVFEKDSLTGDVVPAEIKPAADQRGQVWAVEIAKAPSGTFEDYQLLLGDELPPYLATSPEALLMPSGE